MMVTKEKKERRVYQFEVTRGGLITISIATLAGLLWMFVLGIWVGRGLYEGTKREEMSASWPAVSQSDKEIGSQEAVPPSPLKSPAEQPMANDNPVQDREAIPGADEAGQLRTGDENQEAGKDSSSSRVFFTVQVASLREGNKAGELKTVWEKKGYEVFVVKSEMPQAGVWYRVQIGRFDTVGAAQAAANRISGKEKTKLYLTTVSVPASADEVAKDR